MFTNAITTTAVSSGSAAAVLTLTPAQIASSAWQAAVLQNTGPADVAVGGSGVTAGTGFLVPSGATLLLTGKQASLSAITASGTATVLSAPATTWTLTGPDDQLMNYTMVDSTGPCIFNAYLYAGSPADVTALSAQQLGPLNSVTGFHDEASLNYALAPQPWGAGQPQPAAPLGMFFALCNIGAAVVYAGQSGVTSSTGLPLAPGGRLSLKALTPAYVFAACASNVSGSVRSGYATAPEVV